MSVPHSGRCVKSNNAQYSQRVRMKNRTKNRVPTVRISCLVRGKYIGGYDGVGGNVVSNFFYTLDSTYRQIVESRPTPKCEVVEAKARKAYGKRSHSILNSSRIELYAQRDTRSVKVVWCSSVMR